VEHSHEIVKSVVALSLSAICLIWIMQKYLFVRILKGDFTDLQ